jgi:putative photosynthetic complex assembly protein 2
MLSIALPIAFAIFIWWFATGIVLLLDGLPRHTFRWSHLVSTLLAMASLAGVYTSADMNSAAGAFCGFTSALLVWGWHELSFLTGWVTGPRKVPATAGARGWLRFTQAVQAILWHELGILASGLAIAALTWGAPNRTAMATFAVLWVMRISAKLNVFLGVRNLSMELLPPHLAYLGSYFRQRPMNLLFPFAVTTASVAAVWLVVHTQAAPPQSAAAIGGLLVTTLLVLAIVEHWLLVLPVQSTALWRWAMRNHPSAAPAQAHDVADGTHAKLLHAR